MSSEVCKKSQVICCFNCMGFEVFLARINNRRKRANMDEYAEGDGMEALAMEVGRYA